MVTVYNLKNGKIEKKMCFDVNKNVDQLDRCNYQCCCQNGQIGWKKTRLRAHVTLEVTHVPCFAFLSGFFFRKRETARNLALYAQFLVVQ